MTQLSDKVALITGAGSGIGRAVAELFARAGARVAVVDLSAERAAQTAVAIRDSGGESIFIQADVSNSDAVADMVRETLEKWKRIDVLHNNAGISMSETPLEEIDDALFDQMMAER